MDLSQLFPLVSIDQSACKYSIVKQETLFSAIIIA